MLRQACLDPISNSFHSNLTLIASISAEYQQHVPARAARLATSISIRNINLQTFRNIAKLELSSYFPNRNKYY